MPEDGRDVFRARLKARFNHIDQHLEANTFLLGDAYSIADAHLFVVSSWATWTNFDLSPYRSVLRLRERVSSRKAVVAALAAEGLVPWPSTQPH
jgi:glutathione S-transferase